MTGKGPAYKGMEGLTFKRDGREEVTEREGKGIPPPPPKVKVSRIKD